MTDFNFNKELSFVIAGEAGQGIDVVTHLVAEVVKKNGFNVFYTKEYMSRIKGGCNSSTIRISSDKVCAYKNDADFVFAISKDALEHLLPRICENTIVVFEHEYQEAFDKAADKSKIEFSLLSKEAGGSIYQNTIISGLIMGILNVDLGLLDATLKEIFSGKPDDVIQKNLQASAKGFELGKKLVKEKNISISIKSDKTIQNELLIDGNDAVALGCLAGGVDFVASYPMSPSTGVLTFMAKHSAEFNIIVEQVEDEIAAINMCLGAWYAGARAMTTTSGGGFALMCEGVSLAGMTETPMVIYLGQRPGPATGLPTRMEQGDLNLALYSGHGEFPRIILTPGTLEDAFCLGQMAFQFADKFQVPVFILSDQYLADSCHNIKPFNLENLETFDFIQQTTADYKRYAFTESGISPRGIPGFGEGLVVLDSDEHYEDGHITENLDVRVQMVEKRMSKLDSIRDEVVSPVFFGGNNAENLVVGWGSTCSIIQEALNNLNTQGVAFLYFKQVYPLNKGVLEYFKDKKRIICIENNYTGQFANLLKQELDISVTDKILKYSGLPFSVEELASKIDEVIKT